MVEASRQAERASVFVTTDKVDEAFAAFGSAASKLQLAIQGQNPTSVTARKECAALKEYENSLISLFAKNQGAEGYVVLIQSALQDWNKSARQLLESESSKQDVRNRASSLLQMFSSLCDQFAKEINEGIKNRQCLMPNAQCLHERTKPIRY
jgi:hypothetical protein